MPGAIGGTSAQRTSRPNRLALALGARVLSAYSLPAGTGLYVITEADRSFTTILLKEDY